MRIIPQKVQLTENERKYTILYLKETRNFEIHPAHHHAVETLKNEDTFIIGGNTFWIPAPDPPRKRNLGMLGEVYEGAIGVGLPELKAYFRDIGFVRDKRHTATFNGNVYVMT